MHRLYSVYVCVSKHELRGIELVRTIISQLVLAVAFFKGIFEILSLTKIT